MSKKPEEKANEMRASRSEIDQYFDEWIEKAKKYKTVSEVRWKDTDPNSNRQTMNAAWSWALAGIMFDNFVEMWELLKVISNDVLESEDTNKGLNKKINKLMKDFRKHKPVLDEFGRIMKEEEAEREHWR